ncbi:hypothetical protein GCM10027415_28020 [Humibacter ginsengisoli]
MRSDLRFFIDRGVGSRIVPEGLRAAGWIVLTMDERYGMAKSQLVDDPVWIREASERGEVLITKDRNVAKRPFEAEAISAAEARVLVIASGNLTGQEALTRLVSNETRIERAAADPGPWVLGVYAERLGRIRLRRST